MFSVFGFCFPVNHVFFFLCFLLCFSAFSVFSVLWLAARRPICGQRPGAMGQGPGARGPGAKGQGPGPRGQGPGARGQGPGARAVVACLFSVFGFCFSVYHVLFSCVFYCVFLLFLFFLCCGWLLAARSVASGQGPWARGQGPGVQGGGGLFIFCVWLLFFSAGWICLSVFSLVYRRHGCLADLSVMFGSARLRQLVCVWCCWCVLG